MKEQIQQCIQNCGLNQSRQSLAQSDWLSDAPVDELETLYAQYTQQYEAFLEQCIQVMGAPDAEATEHLKQWYPEALQGVSWPLEDKQLLLLLEHADRDTPIGVCLLCVSQAEIDSLSV